MDGLFGPLNYWHWWILAVVLVIAEVLAPGIFFLWLAIAAGVTGLAVLALPDLGWQYQLLIFAALAVISAVMGRRLYKKRPPTSDHPTLNRRAQQYVGKVFVLDAPIVNGSGRLRVADATWKMVGPDAPAGSRVRVVAADGVSLRVEPATDQADEP